MLQKPLGAITVLGTAIGGPYALFETDLGTNARIALQDMFTSAPSEQTTSLDPGGIVPEGATPLAHGMLIAQSSGSGPVSFSGSGRMVAGNLFGGDSALRASTSSTNGAATGTTGQAPATWTPPPIHDIREVIRFDMHPMLLPQRFGQVTTLTGDPQFEAYRVPLATGISPYDLVGTLTYCFDANKSVQRIQFIGTTGDPSMISSMMIQFYGLRPEASLGGQLFTTRWNNRITSLLHVRPANVMTANSPNGNYHIFLELNQPSTYYGLSEDAYRETGIAPPTRGTSFFGF